MYVNEDIKNLYRVKFSEERADVLRLDMNENPEGLPIDFVEGVKKKITPSFLATYPEKGRLAKLIGQQVDNLNLTITNGSDEALSLAFRCFGKPGSKVLSAIPTFEMYGVYVGMNGLIHKTISYNDDFTFDINELINEIDDDTSIVIILNPNSPIGTTHSEEEVLKVLELSKKHNALVIIDEAYHLYYNHSFMPLVKEYNNLLVLRTFSKLYSIPALRIGYAVGDEALITCIENAQSTFNVNSVGLLFAEELLKRPDIVEALVKSEAEGRSWITGKLKENGYAPISLEGCFVSFKTKRPSSEVVSALKQHNVWTRDYSKGVLSGYLRISTGSVAVMQKFWNKLMEVDYEI